MKRLSFAGASLSIIIFLMLAHAGGPDQLTGLQETRAPQSNQKIGVDADFGKVPLYFVSNKGQLDAQVAYYVQGKDKTLYFTTDGITFVLNSLVPAKASPSRLGLRDLTRDNRETRIQVQDSALPRANSGAAPAGEAHLGRWVVKLDFVGANPEARPVGQDETGALISYFKGRPEDWKSGLPTYSKIAYPNLWPGIDLVYYGTVNKLKYEFIVRPGADPSDIRLAYRGAENVAVEPDGRLKVTTPAGDFSDDVPVAYQEKDGRRIGVGLAYKLGEKGPDRSKTPNIPDYGAAESTEGAEPLRAKSASAIIKERVPDAAQADSETSIEYGFKVGDYDRSLPLILDPAILVYCGFIGGSDLEGGEGIAVDGSGNAYVTGNTYSSTATFPVATGPDLTANGSSDAFVAKVNAAGTNLIYCGFIGGSSEDFGNDIAVDAAGNAYLTGTTYSSAATFPVIVGPDLTHNTARDAFVAKLNATGTALLYCGYIGGWMTDMGIAIAVDGSGNAYVAGLTESDESSFPETVGPDLTFNSAWGDADAFVAKVNSAGTALSYCGYIGGVGDEECDGIAVDGAGNAYVVGYTNSSEATFPVTVGPDLTFTGSPSIFVAKVNAAGTALSYCGYVGSYGYGRGIAVDGSGNAYLTGITFFDETAFPVIVGPDLTYNGGTYDAFVAKLNAAGTSFLYCGYIGGASEDNGNDIAVDSAGNAYVAGETRSTEASFPVTSGPDVTYNGGAYDAFVAKVSASGTQLVYCGYIGGSANDYGRGIAVDSAGSAYVTGGTRSSETTFPVAVGPDLTYNGGLSDAFVAKIIEKPLWLPRHAAGDYDGDGRKELAVDFGAAGIYLYDSGAWSQISASNPESLLPADVDGDNVDEIVADLGATGLWLWNAGAWTQLSGVNVESLAAGDPDADGTDEIVGDFGAVGLWLYNGGAWTQLSGVNADYVTVANVDGGGGDEIFGDFGPTGLWVWNAGTWSILSGVNADYVLTGLQTGARFIAGDFGPTGLWMWSMPGLCTQLSGLDADYMIAANTDGDTEDEIIGDFGTTGLWHCEGSLWTGSGFTWTILSGVNADFMIRADIDGNGTDEVAADFGGIGLWLWNTGAWIQISGVNPEYMLAADVDGDNADEVFADFGSLGLWMWNAGSWSQVSALNPD